MSLSCTVERVGSRLFLKYSNEEFDRTDGEELHEDDNVFIDVNGPQTFDVEDVEGLEEGQFDPAEGLPNGYSVYTFYSGRGSARKPIRSILLGPSGLIGTFDGPDDAVIAAIDDLRQRKQEKGQTMRPRG